jgi:hypothetical protein
MSIQQGLLSCGCHKAAGKPRKVSVENSVWLSKGIAPAICASGITEKNQMIGTNTWRMRSIAMG